MLVVGSNSRTDIVDIDGGDSAMLIRLLND